MIQKQIPETTPVATTSMFETLADALHPSMHRWSRRPQRLVSFKNCPESYFGTAISPKDTLSISDLPTLAWGRDSDFVLDFGIHMVGYLSFCLECVGDTMDAPCRLRLTFGESPLDVTAESMDGVQTWLSRAWLPDEVVNIDCCPDIVRISRRHAFRYLRVQVIDTSPNYKVSLSNVVCDCVSAVDQNCEVDDFLFEDQLLQDIDRISIFTLRDCMQSVFEDGPRRDLRMWIGDLRLQALANYSTFKDYSLVKRCLLQFAAVARDDGSLPASLFQKPRLKAGSNYIVEYDAIFASIVYDYVVASGDLEAGRFLWATVLQCLQRPLTHVNPETFLFESDRSQDIKFLDWNRTADTTAGSHGSLVFCLKDAEKLAKLLNLDFPHRDLIKCMSTAAQAFLVNGVAVSGPNQEVSYASAAWLVLADVYSQDVAKSILLNTMAHPKAVKPFTPYLWHYVCEALITVGCHAECLDIMRSYWGGMVKAGADTFWECYDPGNARASPYGDALMNSFCHAWSCTPTRLLRTELMDTAKATVKGKVTIRDLDEEWIKRSLCT